MQRQKVSSDSLSVRSEVKRLSQESQPEKKATMLLSHLQGKVQAWLRNSLRASAATEEKSHRERFRSQSEIGKQSPKTLLDAFERYIEGYMTLFDAISGVKQWFKHSR